MRRLVLPSAVAMSLGATVAAASLAPAPADLPAVALGAVLVWRAEVAAVLFAAAYAALVTAWLALHGHTFTRVGSAGIEIPQIDAEDVKGRADDVQTVDELRVQILVLSERVTALEDPSHLLLNPDQEGA